jgi:hypothetical protein
MPVDRLSCSYRHYLVYDLSIGLGILLLFALFRSHGDLVLLTSWVLILVYISLAKRFEVLMHQLLATLMAAIWVHFAKDYYAYKIDYIRIFEMNSLPLMAWTLVLFGLGEYCSYCKLKRR